MSGQGEGLIKSLVRYFLTSRMAIVVLLASIVLGGASLMVTPREEEPQIVVPMADVLVKAPGASAEEVEMLVTTPLEKLLWQIDGVEYVYSISRKDAASVTVRFFVGENREDSLIKLHNTILKNQGLAPSIVSGWAVQPVEIDDVPIVTLTLYPKKGYEDRYSDYDLRRIAEELYHRLAELENISRVTLHSGRSREVRVEISPERLAGYNISPLEVQRTLRGADRSMSAGEFVSGNRQKSVVSQSFLLSADDAASLVVGVSDGNPVYLRDVAEIIDGPEEPKSYSRIGFSDFYLKEIGSKMDGSSPAVTISLAKKKGTNAVEVAKNIISRMKELKSEVLPDGIEVRVTRNYGETAQEKVNELLSSLGYAILTVVGLLVFTLGWRESVVVALAVPMSFSLALFMSHLFGYTINRVTLFALILSLGLVVDDPITNVDNIQRHILKGKKNALEATLDAVREVLPPVIMSTLAIIVSFLPLFFITGMMGPYMAPMAATVPLTVTFSTVAALTVVPWMAYLILKSKSKFVPGGNIAESVVDEDPFAGAPKRLLAIYRKIITPFLEKSLYRKFLLGGIVLGLAGSCLLVVYRFVPVKILPFDNKNELQLVIDMPEGTTLEATDKVVRAFENSLRGVPEITDFESFTGKPSPMDFNGMVRHYYWREEPNFADIRINFRPKDERKEQSHAIALRMRRSLQEIAKRNGAVLKIVESPPGPPVISTITTEIYGKPELSYADLVDGAAHLKKLMSQELNVVDIDDSSESPRTMYDFVLDKEKAALHGVSTADVVDTLRLALSGDVPASVHAPRERQALPVRIILPMRLRSGPEILGELRLKTSSGALVPLAELGSFKEINEDQPVYHKNLKRVAYVYAETAGQAPGEVVFDLQSRLTKDPLPAGTRAEWAGEGEWKITIDVFRDLGIAYAAALTGIYVLLIAETSSFLMPLLIMSAIPLTMLGILPGFWLLNVISAKMVGGYATPVFFTATSMIGMIALGGIVIRNSIVLIDFIKSSVAGGCSLKEAIILSGAVRLRPIVLTALTTALGAWPITLDPIFSGLAWALIFGLLASTAFTLVVVPCGYYVMYRNEAR